ncbi:MAG: hypothetical protein JW940_26830 [Polyangiaceae bacterium]|nr:hypothetical protein [Polyangiaceae bacterium]
MPLVTDPLPFITVRLPEGRRLVSWFTSFDTLHRCDGTGTQQIETNICSPSPSEAKQMSVSAMHVDEKESALYGGVPAPGGRWIPDRRRTGSTDNGLVLVRRDEMTLRQFRPVGRYAVSSRIHVRRGSVIDRGPTGS